MDNKKLNEVCALALLATVRKMVVVMDQEVGMERIPELTNSLQPEIRNMLMEHLTNEEITNYLASHILSQMGMTLRMMADMQIALMGKISTKGMIDYTEDFCSQQLGRPVKVVQD